MPHLPQTRPGGRPSKLTAEVIQKVKEILPVALYIETVAAYLSIDRQTFYNWLQRGEKEAQRLEQQLKPKPKAKETLYLEFFATIQKALAEGEFLNALLIRTTAAEGKAWQAAAWLLERRFPERWGLRHKLEHAGPKGGAIPLQLTVDQVLAAHKELEDWQHDRFPTPPCADMQTSEVPPGPPESQPGAPS
jgi:hypothetical protein